MFCLRVMRSLNGKRGGISLDGLKTHKRTIMTRTLIRPSLLPESAIQRNLLVGIICNEVEIASQSKALDILPKISSHPSLAGIQVRNGPRDTYDPSHFVRKRRSGFLARKRSKGGRMILKRRRQKKRSTLSH